MFIILKNEQGKNEILTMFYGQDELLKSIREWIKDYMNKDIEKRENDINSDKNIKEIVYEIEDEYDSFKLIKKLKVIKKGYIYNATEKQNNTIYSINILEYNENKNINGLFSNQHFTNINMEINNRVMKKMDKDSLYGVIQNLQEKIFIKKNINTTEYVGVISEIIKTYKKEAYSSIAKKMKRFGKNNKTLVPSNFCTHGQYQFCKLESLKE